MVPFRGRCPFRQYIPPKPAKYGLEIFWICDANSFYPLKAKPYLDKEGDQIQKNLGRNIVLELSAPFNNSGRNITMDNFFTDLVLATTLLGLLLLELSVKTRLLFHQSFFHHPPEKKSHRSLDSREKQILFRMCQKE